MYPRRGGSAACALAEGIAVGTFRHLGILLMSSHRDAVQTTVVLSHHVVLALRNAALDAFVLALVFHSNSPLSYCSCEQ